MDGIQADSMIPSTKSIENVSKKQDAHSEMFNEVLIGGEDSDIDQ